MKKLIVIAMAMISLSCNAQLNLDRNRMWQSSEIKIAYPGKTDSKNTAVSCVMLYNYSNDYVTFIYDGNAYVCKLDKDNIYIDRIPNDVNSTSFTIKSKIIDGREETIGNGYVNFLYQGDSLIAISILFSNGSYKDFIKIVIFILT